MSHSMRPRLRVRFHCSTLQQTEGKKDGDKAEGLRSPANRSRTPPHHHTLTHSRRVHASCYEEVKISRRAIHLQSTHAAHTSVLLLTAWTRAKARTRAVALAAHTGPHPLARSSTVEVGLTGCSIPSNLQFFYLATCT
jgi:hypothetical protein